MRRAVFLSLGLTVGGVVVGEPEAISVTPAGLTVIWKEQAERHDEREFGHASILNAQHPVALALYVKSTGEKKIVEVMDREDGLASLRDDQGRDLQGTMGAFPRISKDGMAALVELSGKGVVSPKASAVLAKGTLALQLAGKRKATRSKMVEVKKGAAVVIDEELSFEIARAGKPEWGEDPFSVDLAIKRDIPEVAAVRFLDGEGKEIPSSEGGAMRSGFLGRVSVTRSFNLKRKVDSFSVEVERWTDLETVEVPFEVKAGLGGGKTE